MSIYRALEEHPIGSIRLEPAVAVDAHTPVADVVATMRTTRVGHVLVMAGDELVGIFTERDLLMHAVTEQGVPAAPVAEFMSADPVVLDFKRPISHALEPMVKGRYRHLPIHDPRRGYIGVLTSHTLFQFVAELLPGKILNLPPRPHQTLRAPEGA